MTPEVIRRLFEAAGEEGGAYATGLMLIAATGLRKSEMLGLTWKYVDFERGQFFVANQRGADKQLRPPKTTKSQRWLCIQGYMIDALKAWRAEQAEYLALLGIEQADDTSVFNSQLGGFIDPANYDRWWHNFSVDHASASSPKTFGSSIRVARPSPAARVTGDIRCTSCATRRLRCSKAL